MNNPEAKEPMITFRHKTIRRLLHKGEWWFSVVDIVAALTDSTIPRRYWSDLKKKIIGEQGGEQLYAQIVQLKIPSADGKLYESDCANVETLFRIIQSNSLLKNSKKPNETPAFAGVTVRVEGGISTKTTVMLAEAGIPFSCFHSSSPSKTVFQKTANPLPEGKKK